MTQLFIAGDVVNPNGINALVFCVGPRAILIKHFRGFRSVGLHPLLHIVSNNKVDANGMNTVAYSRWSILHFFAVLAIAVYSILEKRPFKKA